MTPKMYPAPLCLLSAVQEPPRESYTSPDTRGMLRGNQYAVEGIGSMVESCAAHPFVITKPLHGLEDSLMVYPSR